MNERALITGITGQDGSYLTELLIHKGYEVHGLVRRTSTIQRTRLDQLNITPEQRAAQLFLHYGDLGESGSLIRIFHKVQPNEIYHLGGQSHVGLSFESPEYTFEANAMATTRLLECIREWGQPVRFYHASSSEMFGRPDTSPQNETTPFRPLSPYACSKTASHYLVACYRESYRLFACNGILYNHESPRRGENFVTRKITRTVAAIKLGLQNQLKLGNVLAQRDWGYAPEYVEAMWKMLQHDTPGDYVIATGELHSVKEFYEAAFATVGLNPSSFVQTDPHQFRPVEAGQLVGDPSKAKRLLGWEPRVRFKDLVQLMVEADLKALSKS